MTRIPKDQTIRAWVDSEYRAHLPPTKKAVLLQHPAGPSEFSTEGAISVFAQTSTGSCCPSTDICTAACTDDCPSTVGFSCGE